MLLYKTLRYFEPVCDYAWIDANGREILCHEVGAQLGLNPAKTYEATVTDDSGEIGRIDEEGKPGEFLFCFDGEDRYGEIEGTSLDGARGSAEFDSLHDELEDYLEPDTMYAVTIKEA